jgi:hypothetical protein
VYGETTLGLNPVFKNAPVSRPRSSVGWMGVLAGSVDEVTVQGLQRIFT